MDETVGSSQTGSEKGLLLHLWAEIPNNCDRLCSAMGQVLPPFIIFAAKQLNRSWTLNEMSGSRYGVSDKGWVDQELSYYWFKDHFLAKLCLGVCFYCYLMATALVSSCNLFSLPKKMGL